MVLHPRLQCTQTEGAVCKSHLRGIVFLESLVGKDPGRTNLHEVAAEFAFQRPFPAAPEIDVVVSGKNVEIAAAGIIPIVAHATVTLDAAVHLMGDERAKVLVAVGSFPEPVFAVVMPGHYGHVLEVALSALIANRAIMGMVEHEPLDNARPKLDRLRVVDGNPDAVISRGHTGHDDLAPRVFLVLELLDRALTACPNGPKRRMPAKIGQIESKGEARLEQVLSVFDLVGLSVNVDRGHWLSPRAAFFTNVAKKIIFKEFESALQRFHGPRGQGAEGMARSQEPGVALQHLQILQFSSAVFDSFENPHQPGQSLAAGSAPATGLLGKEAHHIEHHSNRTGPIV